MPKKTKKDKIIAEYRRKLSVVSSRPEKTETAIDTHSVHFPPPPSSTFSFKPSVTKNETSTTLTLDPQEFSAIKKDLLITLGITGLILIGQMVIWRMVG
jgi:hypothetical protein